MNSFSEHYLKAREKEQRLLEDALVLKLPETPKSYAHHNEWEMRKHSSSVLKKYLEGKKNRKSLLDLGCGNGWMSNYYSKLFEQTKGIDINETEIIQAQRVFEKNKLSFEITNILERPDIGSYDFILISAVIQYFENPKELIDLLLVKYLNPGGEIIISDSFFYSESEKIKAKERSVNYYKSIDCDELIPFYFHHSESIFSDYHYKIVYTQSSLSFFQRIFTFKMYSPFTIYSISS